MSFHRLPNSLTSSISFSSSCKSYNEGAGGGRGIDSRTWCEACRFCAAQEQPVGQILCGNAHLGRPWAFLNVRVEVVKPPLTALLADSSPAKTEQARGWAACCGLHES